MRHLTKFAIALAVIAVILALAACTTESFSFEAHPSGHDEEDPYVGDVRDIECFVIEADSSNGDGDDQQLGEFCRVDDPSDAAREDIENEDDE